MEQRYEAGSLWELARDAIFPPSAFDAAPLQVAWILGLVGATGALDVLDLPCGPGRHSLPLARVGHRVVAVDRTPSYLEELRIAASPDLALEVVQDDMRSFAREEAFDLALNLYHSFGYFEDPADDARVLRNLWRSLRPGGTLVMDLRAEELMTRDFQPHRAHTLPDGRRMEERSELRGDWLHSTWTLTHNGVARPFDMSHRLYSAERLGATLAAAGFGSVRCYGDFDGRPFDASAARLVVAAQR